MQLITNKFTTNSTTFRLLHTLRTVFLRERTERDFLTPAETYLSIYLRTFFFATNSNSFRFNVLQGVLQCVAQCAFFSYLLFSPYLLFFRTSFFFITSFFSYLLKVFFRTSFRLPLTPGRIFALQEQRGEKK